MSNERDKEMTVFKYWRIVSGYSVDELAKETETPISRIRDFDIGYAHSANSETLQRLYTAISLSLDELSLPKPTALSFFRSTLLGQQLRDYKLENLREPSSDLTAGIQ